MSLALGVEAGGGLEVDGHFDSGWWLVDVCCGCCVLYNGEKRHAQRTFAWVEKSEERG